MAQFGGTPSHSVDLPYSTSGRGLITGLPEVLAYGQALIDSLPSVLATSVNEALEEHVEESRKRLKHDEDYEDLASYYDVSQSDIGEFEFGFLDAPDRLQEKITALEFGDAEQPPRAFVRSTLFKRVPRVFEKISSKVNYRLGEGVQGA